MHFWLPVVRPIHTHWPPLVMALMVPLFTACHVFRTRTTTEASSAPAEGIPARPDLVTVVPFHIVQGIIVFPGGIDGVHGQVILDTGAPYVWLTDSYARRDSSGGVDSATTPGTARARVPVTVRTIQVGTLHQHIDSADVGPPQPYTFKGVVTNGLISHGDRFEGLQAPAIGSLGLAALEPFETIVDYPHRRLIFIRLDGAGRRLAAVPAFTPVTAIPLLPWKKYFWGVEGIVGGEVDTLVMDSSTPDGELLDGTLRRIASHLVKNRGGGRRQLVVDRLVVGRRTLDAFAFSRTDEDSNIFGASLLDRLGVVGFNLRTRQLLLYR